MTDLASLIQPMFPAHEVSSSNSIREKRRSLRIVGGKGDEIVRVKLAAGPASQGEKTADALFFCRERGKRNFAIAIVELKGSDFSHALRQIEQTADRYCKKSPPHGGGLRMNHGGRVLGLISCRQAQLPQEKIKRLRRKGIVLRHCKEYEIPLSSLAEG